MKTKISYLPVNLLTSLTTFIVMYVVLTITTELSDLAILAISFGFYMARVDNGVTEDYLQDKIKELENKVK
jgi:uncharacterized membrane protein